jgi:hypothetical protein
MIRLVVSVTISTSVNMKGTVGRESAKPQVVPWHHQTLGRGCLP